MELEERKKELRRAISATIPRLLEMAASDADTVILHQDAFAADYQDAEYLLLGMAIKYLGLHGKEIRIIGTNRETLDERTDKPAKEKHDQPND